MIAVAVTTAPRAIPTLERCLQSLHAAGFSDIVVFDDSDRKRGALENWAYALERMLARSALPYIAIVQDDTRWASGACAVLTREIGELGHRAESAGYLSLHLDPAAEKELKRRRCLTRGWHESKLGWGSIGAQAYVLSREAAVALLLDPQFSQYRATWRKNIDRIVGKCVLDLGRTPLYRVPSLASHEYGSGNSSLRVKPPRDTHHFEEVAR